MNLPRGAEILPQEVTWKFRNISSQYRPAYRTQLTSKLFSENRSKLMEEPSFLLLAFSTDSAEVLAAARLAFAQKTKGNSREKVEAAVVACFVCRWELSKSLRRRHGLCRSDVAAVDAWRERSLLD